MLLINSFLSYLLSFGFVFIAEFTNIVSGNSMFIGIFSFIVLSFLLFSILTTTILTVLPSIYSMSININAIIR